jgi:hypothetical protein
LLVGEDGADERGARPSNGAPEVLLLDRQNPDGTPVYHGWPDRYGFLPANQAVFNPIGGGSDDVCPAPFNQATCLANLQAAGAIPIADVLAFPPQQITSPLALEAADSSFTGIDFVPDAFVIEPVRPGAALYSLEGDFGFSAPNATAPAPEVGHEVKLINFNQNLSNPLQLSFQNFARNSTGNQAFVTNINGFNRPTNIRFRPGWLRLCRGLRCSARSRLRLAFCGSARQWSAGPNSRHRRDLEDLPDVIGGSSC